MKALLWLKNTIKGIQEIRLYFDFDANHTTSFGETGQQNNLCLKKIECPDKRPVFLQLTALWEE